MPAFFESKNMKKVLSLLITVLIILSLSSCGINGHEMSFESEVSVIDKYGNITLSLPATDMIAKDFDYADIVKVNINGSDYEMPVGSNYGDVDEGNMILRLEIDESADTDRIVLAVNMGNFAETVKIARKTVTDTEPGYEWEYNEGVKTPVKVKISLSERGGYMEEYTVRALVRTNERADYAPLSDAEFANFRMIKTTGIGEGKIYRSSSPVNPEIGRNTYADIEMKKAGIKTVMNLADTARSMKEYGTWENSYYSTCNVIPLNLGIDTSSDEFRAGLSEGFKYFLENDGPYLIHCTEGKDRAGFASAVIQCLMGATAEEVSEDYMVTYFNYYDVETGTKQYDIISDIISDSLAKAFAVDDISAEGVDLSKEAEEYFMNELEFTKDEVTALKEKLL